MSLVKKRLNNKKVKSPMLKNKKVFQKVKDFMKIVKKREKYWKKKWKKIDQSRKEKEEQDRKVVLKLTQAKNEFDF